MSAIRYYISGLGLPNPWPLTGTWSSPAGRLAQLLRASSGDVA